MTRAPLHCCVAEALGWTRIHRPGDHDANMGAPCGDILIADPERMRWKGRAPNEMVIGADCTLIPRYDTDWSATGPLIEKYRIGVEYDLGDHINYWIARRYNFPEDSETEQRGPTPLIAVCNLILALKEAGKL